MSVDTLSRFDTEPGMHELNPGKPVAKKEADPLDPKTNVDTSEMDTPDFDSVETSDSTGQEGLDSITSAIDNHEYDPDSISERAKNILKSEASSEEQIDEAVKSNIEASPETALDRPADPANYAPTLEFAHRAHAHLMGEEQAANKFNLTTEGLYKDDSGELRVKLPANNNDDGERSGRHRYRPVETEEATPVSESRRQSEANPAGIAGLANLPSAESIPSAGASPENITVQQPISPEDVVSGYDVNNTDKLKVEEPETPEDLDTAEPVRELRFWGSRDAESSAPSAAVAENGAGTVGEAIKAAERATDDGEKGERGRWRRKIRAKMGALASRAAAITIAVSVAGTAFFAGTSTSSDNPGAARETAMPVSTTEQQGVITTKDVLASIETQNKPAEALGGVVEAAQAEVGEGTVDNFAVKKGEGGMSLLDRNNFDAREWTHMPELTEMYPQHFYNAINKQGKQEVRLRHSGSLGEEVTKYIQDHSKSK